jgi:predicted RNA binding protein YcfA (HicA-like mRNA interferase family)
VLLTVAAVVVGCSGKLVALDGESGRGRHRHRELGYEIDFPSVLGQPGWSRENLEGSDLVFQHRDGSTWTLASHCRRTRTPASLLAGELARAARNGTDVRSEGGPVQLAGLEGWAQRLEAKADGMSLAIKTVTLRGTRCVYDWVLLAPTRRRLEELEPRFEAWWRSFRPGPGELVRESTRGDMGEGVHKGGVGDEGIGEDGK